ncbi:MAG: hypothetical protein QF415_16520 [Candidatus Undinarchaeales archaeon]|nr:hypothetical protein [Candidatus Undinarchaeales archaeon]MDP7492908.1 hypothetical protein [Candidatus Undinarchaeales archaeon]
MTVGEYIDRIAIAGQNAYDLAERKAWQMGDSTLDGFSKCHDYVSDGLTNASNANGNTMDELKSAFKSEFYGVKAEPAKYVESAFKNGALWFMLGGGPLSPAPWALATCTVTAGLSYPFVMGSIQRLFNIHYGEYRDVHALIAKQVVKEFDAKYQVDYVKDATNTARTEAETHRQELVDQFRHELRRAKEVPEEQLDSYANDMAEYVIDTTVQTVSDQVSGATSRFIGQETSQFIAKAWAGNHEIFDSNLLETAVPYKEIADKALNYAAVDSDNIVDKEVFVHAKGVETERGKDILGSSRIKYVAAKAGRNLANDILGSEAMNGLVHGLLNDPEFRGDMHSTISSTLDEYSLLISVLRANPAKGDDRERLKEYIHTSEREHCEDLVVAADGFADTIIRNEYQSINEKAANKYSTLLEMKLGTSGQYDLSRRINNALADYGKVVEEITADGTIEEGDWAKFDFCLAPEKGTDADYHKLTSDIAGYAIAALADQSDSNTIERGRKAEQLLRDTLEFVYLTSMLKEEGTITDAEKVSAWQAKFEDITKNALVV